MPLIRGHHDFDDHFTQIPNAWIRDERLSFKARGLISYILSHKPEWSLTVEWLAANNPEGKEALRSAIQELELYGYLKREQKNEGGRFQETIWRTCDPVTDLPLTENPLTENRALKNTITKNTIVKNIEREQFDQFWAIYPKKADKGQALRHFKRALNRATFDQILAGAIAYANDPNLPEEKRYIKNPATWLNADAWENGPLPERSRRKGNSWEDLTKWAEEQDRMRGEK